MLEAAIVASPSYFEFVARGRPPYFHRVRITIICWTGCARRVWQSVNHIQICHSKYEAGPSADQECR